MYTLIETIHQDNGAWWNERTEFDTAQEALDAASSRDETSSVEVIDENGVVILPLSYPAQA